MSLPFADLSSFIFFIIALLVAIDIHEFAHAWMADKLGDPTPRANGRLTLNPLAHLDPLGSLVMAFLIFSNSPIVFGWGKPVPIDPFNLRNPRRDSAIISLAGPLSNFILALLLALLLRLPFINNLPFISLSLFLTIRMLVVFGVFNLLPIPPLDGSKILFGLLPPDLATAWEETLNQYGLILLILILFPFFGGIPLVSLIVSPIINFILSLLL